MITEALGIKGWGRMLDKLILTSIITGDPLLMLSNYGQGKTALVDRFGQVLLKKLKEERPDEAMIVAVINAATANPQDWAGYFVPVFGDSNKTNAQMTLLESPLSLINAVLIAIDEISRAASRNQNNILSLIQERRVDGVPTKCEILFAMMNPVIGDDADEGSEPLIGALADRFALLIEPPMFSEMNNDNKKEVINFAYPPTATESVFSNTGKALGKTEYKVSDSVCDSIWSFLVSATNLYRDYCFNDKHHKMVLSVVDYVSSVASMLSNDKGSGFYISGRRAGMLTRAILANNATAEILGTSDMAVSAYQVLMNGMINKAMGKTHNALKLNTAHEAHRKLLKFGGTAMAIIMAEPDKRERLKLAFKHKIKPNEFTRIYKDYTGVYKGRQFADVIIGMALINKLAEKMSKHEVSVIASLIIEATKVPVSSISINMQTEDDVMMMNDIMNVSENARQSVLTLCLYVCHVTGGQLIDNWRWVSQLYFEAKLTAEV